MKSWKRCLLDTYCHATAPYRWWQNLRDARSGRAPVLVLFYHRVADDHPTPWSCSNAVFRRQMLWLKRRFEMVSLAEAQRRIRSGHNHHPTVAITFDDGYADNCREALPLLLRERIPCTYFVSTRYVFEGLPFPHDVALGHRFAPNTVAQLRELAAAGIDIGAHTRTHPDLGRIHDPGRLHDEVVAAGEELQAAVGKPVRFFAFPFGLFGNLNAAAFHMAYDAGYEGVCSAYGAMNFPGDDAFHIQRIHGDDNMSQFRNWMTIDPRKRNLPRYDYHKPAAAHTPETTRA